MIGENAPIGGADAFARQLADYERRIADLERASGSATRRIGGSWRRFANQTIPNVTVTPISWDTEDADTDGFLTPTSNAATIPAGRDGLYVCSATVGYDITALGQNLLRVTIAAVTFDFSGNTAGSVQSVTVGPIPLVAGNTIQVATYQASGSDRVVTGRLYLYRVGA